MKIKACCIPCIASVRAREILESRLSDEKKVDAIKVLFAKISEWIAPTVSTIELASKAFRLVKSLTGDDDPYREYKVKSNEIALKLEPLVRKRLSELEGFEKFKTALLVSVNANSLDPGVPSFAFSPDELSRILFKGTFEVDNTHELYSYLSKIKNVVYLLDNAGEAVFDKIVVELLVELGINVTVVAKSGAYQNDVTLEEAQELGFDKIARLIGTGNDYAGLLPGTFSDEVKKALKEADLVFSKGMAHYETYLYTPYADKVFFLLKAKCKPVASTLGVKVGANVALLRV